MLKTYKFRLYPTKKQTERLIWMLDICRIIYNSALADRNRYYEETGMRLSRIDQQKILVRDKKNIPYLKEIHSQVLQDILFRVEKAYQGFFRRVKINPDKAGYPRYKGIGRYDSITYSQSGFDIIGGKLKLSKIGSVKLKQHRNINGDIKTCNIKKESDKWYVCFSVEYAGKEKNTHIITHTGIDMGIKDFAIFSDSNRKPIENPKHLIKSEKRLIRKQRRLSSKKKGSNNRKKARLVLNRTHKYIANQRKDFQHKKAREIVNSYDAIGVEDLRISNMVKNHHLAKSISDGGWGQFISYLEYKAEEAGKLFMKVNPRNTSKTCSACGYIKSDMTLSDRSWTCPNCNILHDRDINAARNIDKRMLDKIRQELPKYTLGETGYADDIADSNIYALKSTPSLNQEAC